MVTGDNGNIFQSCLLCICIADTVKTITLTEQIGTGTCVDTDLIICTSTEFCCVITSLLIKSKWLKYTGVNFYVSAFLFKLLEGTHTINSKWTTRHQKIHIHGTFTKDRHIGRLWNFKLSEVRDRISIYKEFVTIHVDRPFTSANRIPCLWFFSISEKCNIHSFDRNMQRQLIHRLFIAVTKFNLFYMISFVIFSGIFDQYCRLISTVIAYAGFLVKRMFFVYIKVHRRGVARFIVHLNRMPLIAVIWHKMKCLFPSLVSICTVGYGCTFKIFIENFKCFRAAHMCPLPIFIPLNDRSCRIDNKAVWA